MLPSQAVANALNSNWLLSLEAHMTVVSETAGGRPQPIHFHMEHLQMLSTCMRWMDWCQGQTKLFGTDCLGHPSEIEGWIKLFGLTENPRVGGQLLQWAWLMYSVWGALTIGNFVSRGTTCALWDCISCVCPDIMTTPQSWKVFRSALT